MRAAWHAELLKILTVRSLRVGAVLATAATPFFSLLVVSTGGLGSADTVTSGAATGTLFGLLAYGAWAAAVASSEFVHGTVVVSLSCVPRRSTLYGAKIAAVAAIAGAGGLAAALLSLALVHLTVPPGHHEGDPAALLVIALAAVAVAVVGAATGFLLRTTTASIALVVAALLLPKTAAGLLGSLQEWVVGASPGTVVTQAVQGGQLAADQTFPGGAAFAALTMLALATAVVVGGHATFARRDGA